MLTEEQVKCIELLNNTSVRDQCLIWEGPIDEKGYGVFKWKGKKTYVHRFILMYNQFHPMDAQDRLKKFRVKWACDRTICINPNHLSYDCSKPEKVWVPMPDWHMLYEESAIRGMEV